MRLYGYSRSSAAFRVRIALNLKGLSYEDAFIHLGRPVGPGQAAIETWYNHWIASGFAALEGLLSAAQGTGAFCHGDRPGLADIALVPQVVNAERYQLDKSPYPTIARIFAGCMEL